MRVLAASTSGLVASICLLEDAIPVTSRSFHHPMQLLQHLVPELSRLLSEAHLDCKDVDLYAVDVGPGSFTGVRVGVTVMKSLAWAARKPAIGVTSLRALASADLPSSETTIVACVRSRPGMAYWQAFVRGESGQRNSGDPALDGFDMLHTRLSSLGIRECCVRFADPRQGEGERLRKVLLGHGISVVELRYLPVAAEDVGRLAYLAYHQGTNGDPFALNPCYVVPPEIGPRPRLSMSE